MSGSVAILRGLESNLCGTSEEAKFSLTVIFSLWGVRKNKENALISCYFMS